MITYKGVKWDYFQQMSEEFQGPNPVSRDSEPAYSHWIERNWEGEGAGLGAGQMMRGER